MRFRVPVVLRGYVIIIAGDAVEAEKRIHEYEGWRIANALVAEKILLGESNEIVEEPKEGGKA